jgi:hypothetical protein
MQKLKITLLLAAASQLFAGGFWLQLGNPQASAEARQHHAVLTIQAVGCHDPASARVTGDAIGLVDGQVQTIALKLIPLTAPGSYALAEQWPATGHWVIRLVARNGDQFTNTLVTAGPQGLDRLHAKSDRRPFADNEVRALLEN